MARIQASSSDYAHGSNRQVRPVVPTGRRHGIRPKRGQLAQLALLGKFQKTALTGFTTNSAGASAHPFVVNAVRHVLKSAPFRSERNTVSKETLIEGDYHEQASTKWNHLEIIMLDDGVHFHVGIGICRNSS